MHSVQKLVDEGKIPSYEDPVVSTTVTAATKFYNGEDYHQRYLEG